MGVLIGPKNVEILEFQKVEISKIQICQGCSLIFLVFFEVIIHEKYGVQGSTTGPKKQKFSKFQNPSKKYWNRSGIDF